MSVVTGLREVRGDRVAVELDGRRWRTFAADVLVHVPLRVGQELDRARLRELARARRRRRALEAALKAVARRDQTTGQLRRRLERRRVAPADRERALERLVEAGLVDDERYARRRAESLAERGHGDAAIRWLLGREGIGDDAAERAVSALEPEAERARRLVEVRGSGARTARELARRGFGEEAVAAAGGDVADGS